MRLRSLKLAGFKSFVDPVTLHFRSDLTAILGPNGCGKSNVIDAIRWVMGESSARQLRGEAMSDVIFAGSAQRAAVSQASVELCFENTLGKLGGNYNHYHELSVKRLVSRQGGSDYFLNGTRCRRRDITDIFLGTGLGPRSYAVIEQGMINRLVDARPEDMRVFLEEAAGVSRYQARRRETGQHLEQARLNLNRLVDVREELESQIRSLKRQSQAAIRYKALEQEMRRCQQELWSLQWHAQAHEQSQYGQRLQEQGQELIELRQHVSESDQEWQRIQASITQRMAQSQPIQQRWLAAQEDKTRTQHALDKVRHDHDQAVQRESQQEQSYDTLKRQQHWDQEELERLRQQLAALESELNHLEGSLPQLRHAVELAQQHAQQADEQTHWLRERSQQGHQHIQQLQQRIQGLDKNLARIEQQRNQRACPLSPELQAQRSQAKEALLTEMAHLSSEQKALQAHSEQLHQDIERTELQIQQLSLAIQKHKDELTAAHSELKALNLLDTVQTRSSSIPPEQQLLNQLALTSEGMRHAALMEQWLGEWLWASFEAFPQFSLEPAADASDGVAGQYCIFHYPSSEAKSGQWSNGEWPAGVTPLTRWIQAPHSEFWLRAGIVDSLVVAGQCLPQLAMGLQLVTLDGWVVGHGWQYRLKDMANIEQSAQELPMSILQRRERRTELDRLQAELSESLATHVPLLESSKTELQTHQQELKRIQIQSTQTQTQLSKRELELVRRESDDQALQQQLSDWEAQQALLQEQAGQDREEREELGIELLQREAEQAPLLQALQEATRESTRAHQQQQLSQTQWQQQEIRCQQQQREREFVKEKVALAFQGEQRIAVQLSELLVQRQQQQKLIVGYNEFLPDLELEAEEAGIEYARVADLWLEQQESLKTEQQQQLDQAQQRQHWQEKENRHRESMESTRLRWQECKVKAAQFQDLLKEQNMECLALDQMDLAVGAHSSSSLLTGQDMGQNAGQDPGHVTGYGVALQAGHVSGQFDAHFEKHISEKQRALSQLQQQISRLGELNLAAPAALAEVTERHEQLDHQMADIQQTIDTLETAMQEIDQETRQLFMGTFDRVNDELGRLFPKVFNGGEARLSLEDGWQSGVRLMARPPGKKNSTLALLSGGEKALTALALVFAIFRLNPAPFCLLDEVDAPLDDANVHRFCQLVSELSDQVQFIYITHNKVAMTMAQELIGVTMPVAGASRVVSVTLEQAEAWSVPAPA